MTDDPQPQKVVVTDIRMPFLSMVVFMVKWAIASIPAFLILFVIGAVAWMTVLGLLLGAIATRGTATEPSLPAVLGGPPPATQAPAAAPTDGAGEAAYIPRVTVSGVRVGDTRFSGKAVFGEVKNTGDRVLFKVQITIYCLDKDGARIFEKTYHPVLVSEMSFGDAASPLKPGYSRKFGVKLDDAPSEWGKNVEVAVTQIVFADASKP